MPNAISRPPLALPAIKLGGGATGCTPPLGRRPPPRAACECCSASVSCGAGATTSPGPRFIGPTIPFVDRVASACATSGGGAITSDAIAACTTRLGATATSGAGATTCKSETSGTIWRLNRAGAASSGTAGTIVPVAMMFGMATSRSSLRSGGTTMVWERLSASGGTERIGCRA